MSTTSNIIKLNVGGTVFQTTKSTLTKFDGMFRAMFESGIPIETDENGCIFVDRDPKHFRLILSFMRDGDVALPESMTEIEEIYADAKYFLLNGLIQTCEPMIIQENYSKKFRHIENKDKVVETVLRSKKPVLLFKYPTDVYLNHLRIPNKIFQLEELIDEYQEKLNIYFLAEQEASKTSNWECYLYMNGESLMLAEQYEHIFKKQREMKSFVDLIKEDLKPIFSDKNDKK